MGDNFDETSILLRLCESKEVSSLAGVLARLREPKEVRSFAGVDQNIYLNCLVFRRLHRRLLIDEMDVF